MAEITGARLGHYRLAEPIGTGGFATVYRAVDERLLSDVAVKVLAENHALDPHIRERFIVEAQLLRRVASPSVIEIHDVGETDRNQPFIVMSYADRGDLRHRIADLATDPTTASPTLRVSDIAIVVHVLASALQAVHRSGLVHRDVKPDNLLIASHGGSSAETQILRPGERLRLGDLGYAKDLAATSGLTVGGGTHGFNAPEQRTSLGTVDARADIFGASAVIFWLLTGATPSLESDSQRRALSSVGVDDATTSALIRGLDEHPAGRFATIEDWHRAIEAPRRPANAPERTLSEPHEVATSGPVAGRGRTRPVHGLMLVVALMLGATAAAAAIVIADRDSGPQVETMDDGTIRVEDRDGDLRLAVFGPSVATVGNETTFRAGGRGAVSYTWITPEGMPVDAAADSELLVTVTEPGASHVTLIGRHADGRTLAVDFEFDVVP